MKWFQLSAALLISTFFLTACPPSTTTPPPTGDGHTPDGTASTLTLDRMTAAADGVDAVDVTVMVRTAAGSAVAGATVSVSATNGVMVTTPAATDSLGVTHAKLTSTVAVSSSISATVTTASGALPVTGKPTVTFTAGGSTMLVFGVQPAATRVGAAIQPAVTVKVVDAQGRAVTSGAPAITLTLKGGTSGATLTGGATMAATQGVATFAGLSVDLAGSGYSLEATAPGLTAVTSDAFAVTTAGPAHLRFEAAPTNGVAGVALAPAPVVVIEDAQGNLVADATGMVTLSLQATTGMPMLLGTTTVAAVGGRATFSGVHVDVLGRGYTLAATSGQFAGATSAAFDIAAAAPAAVEVTGLPTTAPATGQDSLTVQVLVRDAFGNPVRMQTVVLTTSGTGNSMLTLNDITNDSGATFFLFKSTKAEVKHLTATSGSLMGTSDVVFYPDVADNQMSTLTVSPSSPAAVTTQVVLSATVRDFQRNAVPGQVVTFSATGTGNTLSSTTATTNASGVASITVSSTRVETKTYTAAVGALFSLTQDFTFTPGAPSATTSTLVPATTTVVADGSATTLTATLLDASNNPVPGQTVTLSSTGTATLTQPVGVTDAQGQITGVVATSSVGSQTLTASVGSTAVASTTLNFTAPPVVADLTIAAVGQTVTATRTLAASATLPRVPSSFSSLACPLTGSFSTATPFVYTTIGNSTAAPRTVAIWGSIAPGGMDLDTVMAAYPFTPGPSLEADRRNCTGVTNDDCSTNSVNCDTFSGFSGLLEGQAITIPPGAVYTIIVQSYFSSDTGDFILNAKAIN